MTQARYVEAIISFFSVLPGKDENSVMYKRP